MLTFPFKSRFPSNVQLIHCDLQILEVGAMLLCWRDGGVGQCITNLEEKLFTKIGVGVVLQINHSMSSIGLIIRNVAFYPEDPHENLGEKFSIKDSGFGHGSIIFITTLATIIGISIGLGLVGLTVLKTRAGHHPFHLGNTEDLQHITSSEDITIGNQKGKYK